jgi:Eukaryotic aspartyl protease
MNLTSKVYWQVELNSAAVLGSGSFTNQTQTINFTTSVKNLVLDSGSTYTYIPSSDYSKLLTAI